jgi:hypothetical protein
MDTSETNTGVGKIEIHPSLEMEKAASLFSRGFSGALGSS